MSSKYERPVEEFPLPEWTDSERLRAGRRLRFKSHAIVTGLLILTLGCLALGAGGRWLVHRWGQRPWGRDGETVALSVQPGTSLRALADQLAEAGVVSSGPTFLSYVYLKGKRGALQAGQYRFELPLAPAEVIERLQHGTFQRSLTVPEGWTAARIERMLLDEGWIGREGEWTALASEPVSLKRLGIEIEEGAEGFCFPDTYFFERGTGARAIRDRMIERFQTVWRELSPEERSPQSENLSVREVVILASMIEREARNPDELPLIASVYLNRLERGMRLQCCATVHYALGEVWDRPLTHADLKVDSPYNTYARAGLPPGPIGNPGRAALAAVLRPEPSDYLYYVYRGDGTHEFTRTYREHRAAARRFREQDPAAQFAIESP